MRKLDFKTPRRLRAALGTISLAATLAAGPASAHLITGATGIGNQVFAGSALLGGMTTPAFALGAGERFSVQFSAECAVNAPAGNFTAYTEVDIIVRAGGPAGAIVQVVPPTAGIGDIFCSANGTAGFDGHARNAVGGVGGGLPAGVYVVQVIARSHGGAIAAWYGDRSLSVSR